MNPLFHTEASTDLPSQPLSAGRMLRAAREAQGLHLAVLSVNLKVSVRQLEALEADQYDLLKGATFVRALAQSVCRMLKIDPAPVLAALPQSPTSATLEPVSLAARQAVRPARVRSGSGGASGLSRQVLVLALLMLVGVAALVWWPQAAQEASIPAEEAQDPVQQAVAMGQASDPAEASSPVSSPEAPASAPVLSSPTALQGQASAAASAVPAAAAAPFATQASTAAPARATEASLPLVLRLKADAWIEVRDRLGQMAVKRIVKAGETLQLDSPAPLFVYVGRADSTELIWQGQAIDLKAHAKNNEARLQLKP